MAAIDRSNSVAADTATQQRIAALPPEVHSSTLSVGLKGGLYFEYGIGNSHMPFLFPFHFSSFLIDGLGH